MELHVRTNIGDMTIPFTQGPEDLGKFPLTQGLEECVGNLNLTHLGNLEQFTMLQPREEVVAIPT